MEIRAYFHRIFSPRPVEAGEWKSARLHPPRWIDAISVLPFQGVDVVQAYIPDAVWYDYDSVSEEDNGGAGGALSVRAGRPAGG